mgnify:CR=1 FL=1|jgi:hypothetical protein
MLIRVNKNTGNRPQAVKYAALSTGTISHVWYDDESTPLQKRTNHIKMTMAKPNTLVLQHHDA